MNTRIEREDLNAPINIWLPLTEIEPAALAQLENAARHPEVGSKVAAMPDTHVGYGVTIGSVLPTINSVLPNAVGVDIGCGMGALNTQVRFDAERMGREFWRNWMGQVQRNVPTGFGTHRAAQPLGELDRPLRATALQAVLRERAPHQIGTLGGGNHFMEAQVDEEGFIWLMVHSGSRHTGLRIAGHYNALAEEITARRGIAVPKDLPSLPLDDQSGQDYLHDAAWATDFAFANRARMLSKMVDEFGRAIARIGLDREIAFEPNDHDFINIHHNFAQLEEVDGTMQVVHRKGATSAFEGQLGIIPGSMGANSYIVRGKGNPESLQSCSHGAGRQMSRGVARKTISDAEFASSVAGTFSKPSRSYVDEAPSAYKDIETVMQRQADLVDIVHTLRPIITIKGDSRAKDD